MLILGTLVPKAILTQIKNKLRLASCFAGYFDMNVLIYNTIQYNFIRFPLPGSST